MISQLHNHWSAVLAIIDYEGDFSPNLRETLRKIVYMSNKIDVIRRELALMHDIGKYLVPLCYLAEGDKDHCSLCTRRSPTR